MAVSGSSANYALPQIMDSTFAPKLQSDLLGLLGSPVDVSGEAVERVSTLCLQVLLSAASTWTTGGHGFKIHHPSGPLMAAFNLLGIETDNLVRMA